jgi:hypothetical protein
MRGIAGPLVLTVLVATACGGAAQVTSKAHQSAARRASPAPTVAPDPFNQADVDAAVAAAPIVFEMPSAKTHPGTGPAEVYGAKAMYFLSLVDRVDPRAASSSGTTVADALLGQVSSVIAGGHEPSASGDIEGWAHNGVAQALLLARHEPNVWGRLAASDQGRIDDLMQAMGVGGNWGYNDANNFATGIGQFGNFRKTDNPNYREGYVGVEVAVIQYFGAARWDQMLSSFSYDAMTAKLQADGFTNITASWAHAGRALMEGGGRDTAGGSGAGVRMPFVYMGHHSSDLIGIYDALATFTWGEPVTSTVSGTSHGVPVTAHIDDNTTSPFESQKGMEHEFNSTDSTGLRSDALYAYEGFMNSLTTRSTMFALGDWGCGAPQTSIVNLESVGVGDLLYKLQHGYAGVSTRGKRALSLVNESTPASDGPTAKGYEFDKDNWLNYTSKLNTAC